MKDKTIEYFEQKMRESKLRRDKISETSSILESLQCSFSQRLDIVQQKEEDEDEALKEIQNTLKIIPSKQDQILQSDQAPELEQKQQQQQQKEKDKDEAMQNTFKIVPLLKQDQILQIDQAAQSESKNPIEKQKLSKELGIINNIDEILKRQKKRLQFDLPISEMAKHLNKPMDFTTSKKEFTIDDPEFTMQKILQRLFQENRIQKTGPTQTMLPNEIKISSTVSNIYTKEQNKEVVEKFSETVQSKLSNIVDKTKNNILTNEDKQTYFPEVKFILDVADVNDANETKTKEKAQETNDNDDYNEIINLIENQQKLNEQRNSKLNSSLKKSENKSPQVRQLSEKREAQEFKDKTPQKHQTPTKAQFSPTSQLQLLKQEKKILQQQQNSIESKKPQCYNSLKENIQQIKKVYNNSSSKKKNDFQDSYKKNSDSKQQNPFHDFLVISPVKKEDNLSQYYENSNIKDNLSYSQSMDCSVFQEIIKENNDHEHFRFQQSILDQPKTLEQIYQEDEVLQNLLQQAQAVQEEINELNDEIIQIEKQL